MLHYFALDVEKHWSEWRVRRGICEVYSLVSCVREISKLTISCSGLIETSNAIHTSLSRIQMYGFDFFSSYSHLG